MRSSTKTSPKPSPKPIPNFRLVPTVPALLAVALAACSLAPEYQRPGQPVPQAYPTGPAYSTNGGKAGAQTAGQQGTGQPAQPDMATADLGWREFFPDARLQRLIELALAGNRDLRVATLAIDEARAKYRIQRAAQFPNVQGNAGLVSQRVAPDIRAPGQSAEVNTYGIGVGFTAYELDFFGRVRNLKEAALQDFLATEEARRSAQISLVAEVADAYLTLQADQQLLRISQDTLAAQQSAADMVSRSKGAGAMAQIDLHRADTQVQTAQVGVEQYTRQVAQDENALALLIGGPLPPDLPPGRPFDGQGFVIDPPEGLPSALLERRPDIIAAEHRLKGANANIGAARAAFFPTISLTGALGASSTTLAGLFSAGMATWLFAPQITVPIFNAGSNQANLDASRVRKDINVALYEKTIQTAFREVADSLAARTTLDRQAAAQQKLVDETRETQRLTQIRFRNGVDDYFPVFDAQRQTYTAEQALVTLQLARLTSRVSLYRALGGGVVEGGANAGSAANAGTSGNAPAGSTQPPANANANAKASQS